VVFNRELVFECGNTDYIEEGSSPVNWYRNIALLMFMLQMRIEKSLLEEGTIDVYAVRCELALHGYNALETKSCSVHFRDQKRSYVCVLCIKWSSQE
jgi:hypothetical protein